MTAVVVYSCGKSPQYPVGRRLGRPWSWCGSYGGEEIHAPTMIWTPTHSQLLYPLHYLWILLNAANVNNWFTSQTEDISLWWQWRQVKFNIHKIWLHHALYFHWNVTDHKLSHLRWGMFLNAWFHGHISDMYMMDFKPSSLQRSFSMW
jgi:hypothetical protein